MAASDLLYTQGLVSYSNSKGAKLKKLMNTIVFPSLRLVYGERVFRLQRRMVSFSAGTNGE